MSILDRRSGRDRRKFERYRVDIDIEWESLVGRKKGTISDLSEDGCFILSAGEVEDGETVKIYLPLSDGMKVLFWGEVVNHVFEIGFAAKFIELTESQEDFLEKFVDTLRKV